LAETDPERDARDAAIASTLSPPIAADPAITATASGGYFGATIPATAAVLSGDIPRGTSIGRYLVLGALGRGGMGVVYAAYDPELDRKLAIKVFRGVAHDGSSRTRMQREAQALARLSHPNVIAAFDVGEYEESLFIAMELVDGGTLRHWQTERGWREILDGYIAAARGLAAAHAAGLVHRDFKPDNVLVGPEKRVRVTDFGLVRVVEDASAPTPSSPSGLRDSDLTIDGAVLGTPGYMSPEQVAGEKAGERTDQFSWCVALWEALYKQLPFAGASLDEINHNMRTTPPRALAETPVPRRVERVLARGLAVDPEDRWPSLDALVAALQRALPRRRLPWIASAAAVLVASIVAVAATRHVSQPSAAPELCTGVDRRLVGVWDAHTRRTIRDVFIATKSPYAVPSFAGIAKVLDAFAGKWTAAVTESCEATRIRGEQTDEVQSLRQDCYDQRLDQVRALTRVLAGADADLVARGDEVLTGLDTSLSTCANVAALKAPRKVPAEIHSKVAEIYTQIHEADADVDTGNYAPAAAIAHKAVDEAAEAHWDPVTADALLVQGRACGHGNAAALTAFSAAAWAAMRGKRDDLLARAALDAAGTLAVGLDKADVAEVWIELAKAALARIGTDPSLEVQIASTDGLIAAARGDLDAAVAFHEKAFAEARRDFGDHDARLVRLEGDLAASLLRSGAFAKAAEHLEHAIVLRTASVGPDHPDLAILWSNLATAYMDAHEPAKAKAAFARALALREKISGKDSPEMMGTLANYAQLLAKTGDNETAATMIERARKIAAVEPGTGASMYHTLLTMYGDILLNAGRLADARAMYGQALVLEENAKSSIMPATLASRARLAEVEHAWKDAQTFAERSIAGYETAGGKNNPALWRPLTILAKAKVALGKRAQARPLFVRAIAIGEKAQLPAENLAPARAALAQLAPPSHAASPAAASPTGVASKRDRTP